MTIMGWEIDVVYFRNCPYELINQLLINMVTQRIINEGYWITSLAQVTTGSGVYNFGFNIATIITLNVMANFIITGETKYLLVSWLVG